MKQKEVEKKFQEFFSFNPNINGKTNSSQNNEINKMPKSDNNAKKIQNDNIIFDKTNNAMQSIEFFLD